MTRLEEIYQKHWENEFKELSFNNVLSQHNHVYLAMKEYAEWYAKRCLEIAAENAESITDIDKYIYGSIVDKSSILNINLPNHE